MTFLGVRRLIRPAFLVLILLGLLFGLSCVGLLPWSRINCWTNEVDINTGRLRDTRYLFWLPFRSSVSDSTLTTVLEPADLAGQQADWNLINTLSPNQHYSPHHGFHGAFGQIKELELCWEFGNLPPAAQRESAREVLRLWRKKGRYYGAQGYLDELSERARLAHDAGKTLDLSDLPVP